MTSDQPSVLRGAMVEIRHRIAAFGEQLAYQSVGLFDHAARGVDELGLQCGPGRAEARRIRRGKSNDGELPDPFLAAPQFRLRTGTAVLRLAT